MLLIRPSARRRTPDGPGGGFLKLTAGVGNSIISDIVGVFGPAPGEEPRSIFGAALRRFIKE